MMADHALLFGAIVALLFSRPAWANITCYRCSSSETFQCADSLPDNTDLVPESCDDIHGAQYCVKTTGTFEASAINCYRCDTFDDNACSENFDYSGLLTPESCDDVFEAQYCIKTTGLYKGNLGTQRFCSAVDLGNYCEYIKREGDTLEYRSCVYTCSQNGCNRGEGLTINHFLMILSMLASLFATCSEHRSRLHM